LKASVIGPTRVRSAARVTAHQPHNLAVKLADLLLDGIARLETMPE
jgi:hypothetical protein